MLESLNPGDPSEESASLEVPKEVPVSMRELEPQELDALREAIEKAREE